MTNSPKRSKSLIVISEHKDGPTIPKYEIFLGNLKYDCSTRFIICTIQQLFLNINIKVPDFRFTVFQRYSKKNPRKYAFVVLSNKNEENQAYRLEGLKNLDILVDGLPLQVRKRRSVRSKKNKRIKVSFDGNKTLLKRSRSAPMLCTCDDGYYDDEVMNREMTVSQYKKELYRGQHLPGEDRVTEYKRGSGNYLKNMLVPHIRKYICAFLNSEGKLLNC